MINRGDVVAGMWGRPLRPAEMSKSQTILLWRAETRGRLAVGPARAACRFSHPRPPREQSAGVARSNIACSTVNIQTLRPNHNQTNKIILRHAQVHESPPSQPRVRHAQAASLLRLHNLYNPSPPPHYLPQLALLPPFQLPTNAKDFNSVPFKLSGRGNVRPTDWKLRFARLFSFGRWFYPCRGRRGWCRSCRSCGEADGRRWRTPGATTGSWPCRRTSGARSRSS